MDYPRRELLTHVAHRENLCLNTMRQTKMPSWRHAVVSDSPTPAVYVEIKDGSNLFPLYLYPQQGSYSNGQGSLITARTWKTGKDGRVPNFNANFISQIESKLYIKFIPDEESDLRMTCGPEDVFAYIYAVLNCPSYQSRYNDLLKLDFPRICLVSDKEQFADLARLGAKLIQAHLMRNSNSSQIRVSFPVSGDNIVAASAPRFTDIDPQSGNYLDQPRIYINQTQYFENISENVWEAEIGGYQVLRQWIEDRRGESLSYTDLNHYQSMVMSLCESLELIDEIDATSPNWSSIAKLI